MHFIKYLNQKRYGLVTGGRCGIRGEFRLINYDYKGRVKHDTGWFDNLITDQGLENMGKKGGNNNCWADQIAIGDSTTPPSYSDTALGNQWQGAGFNYNSSSGNFVETYGWGDPIPWMATQNYGRFGSGTAGTVNEVGLGSGNTTSYLSCRQLLPTPFVKGSTDVLDVYYKAYWYFDTGDVTGTCTLDGTLYNWTGRLGGFYGTAQGYDWGTCFYPPDNQKNESGSIADGELATVYQSEGGLSGERRSVISVNQGATCGVGERWNELYLYAGLGDNLTSDTMRCLHTHNWTGRICTQTRLGRASDDNPVPFTDRDIMSVRHRLYFDRFTPDLFASAGAFTLTGVDIGTSVA